MRSILESYDINVDKLMSNTIQRSEEYNSKIGRIQFKDRKNTIQRSEEYNSKIGRIQQNV
ncbi:hypothetical protein [Acanthamoeba castellanii mimivirus]|uniref:Uncharacterized protein n=4 Tax=Mimivirus TaxID=315393 RepID=E3VYR1_MIMIV|nr:hypothetical protein MIMI_gp0978 [Acanthamoeba polyphaga mimivirus]AMK61706.1 hypothetical protein [Samba virus]BAV61085.1 hypothetical protein [Acanthamoeba castellanii mimivirus]ADO18459.1 hypothetical protein [Acanthamoeba polyphaga mimivirus]AKI81593.1 hypothetical protein [Acanthamoeba polyphaga mimivirus]AMK62110.1 hypothetical protein [Samba virus]